MLNSKKYLKKKYKIIKFNYKSLLLVNLVTRNQIKLKGINRDFYSEVTFNNKYRLTTKIPISIKVSDEN